MKIAKKLNIGHPSTSGANSNQNAFNHTQSIHSNSNEIHSRKNSSRGDCIQLFQNTQPLNIGSLGLNSSDKYSHSNVLLSESQPVLARANDKPNIMMSNNNQHSVSQNASQQNALMSSSTHRRNPSHQYPPQISINEIPISSLSGSSGSAYMLKLQKYKKMKSELSNQQAKNVIKKCVAGQSQIAAHQQSDNTMVSSVKQVVMLNSQPSQKNTANNSLTGGLSTSAYNSNNNHHPSSSSISQSTKHSHTSQIVFNSDQLQPHNIHQQVSTKAQNPQKVINNNHIEYIGKENTNLMANSQNYLQSKQSTQQIKLSNNNQNHSQSQLNHSLKSQTLKFSINNLLNEITQKSNSNVVNTNHINIKPPSSKSISQHMLPQGFNGSNNNGSTISSSENNSSLTQSSSSNNNTKNISNTTATTSLTINNNHVQNKLMMQSIIAAKNHSTLINPKHINSSSNGSGLNKSNLNGTNSNQSQQQLVSSKMMMALHKKCNSIANTSNVSNYVINQTNNLNGGPSSLSSKDDISQSQSSNVTSMVVLDQDNMNVQIQQDVLANSQQYHSNQVLNRSKPSQSNLLANYNSNQNSLQQNQLQHSHQQSKKNLGSISQVEFFDENVRVNHVPQITPRHTDKRKTLAAQPNDRYKNADNHLLVSSQQQFMPPPPLSVKNADQSYQINSNANFQQKMSNNPLEFIQNNINNYYSRSKEIGSKNLNIKRESTGTQNSQNVNKRHSSYTSTQNTSLANQSKKQTQSNVSLKIDNSAYQSNPNPNPVMVATTSRVTPNKRYNIQETSSSSELDSSHKKKTSLREEEENNSISKKNKINMNQPAAVKIDLMNTQLQQNSILQKSQFNEESSRAAFELKRRSCGPSQNDNISSIDILENQDNIKEQLNSALMHSQRLNPGAFTQGFGLRKFSQQLQFNNKLTSKCLEMDQQNEFQNQQNQRKQQQVVQNQQQECKNLNQLYRNDNYQSAPKDNKQQQPSAAQQNRLRNPKEEIISFFTKYIKQNKPEMLFQDEQGESDETIQNLRDFLQYLEDKNIINCHKLENDKEEMTNLIQDLMKLDLKKFSSGIQNQPHPNTCKNSPKHSNDDQDLYNQQRYASNNPNQIKQQHQYYQHSKKNSYDSLKNESSNNLVGNAQISNGLQIPSNPTPLNFTSKRNSADFYNQNQSNGASQQQNQPQKQYQQSVIQSPSTYGINSNIQEKQYRSIPRNKNKQNSSSIENTNNNNINSNSYKHKLPLNSPNQDYHSNAKQGSGILSKSNNNTGFNSRTGSQEHSNGASQMRGGGNIVCYYAPVNVNGNGNIVNTNFQIFPNGPINIPNSNNGKAFNCSQQLFNNSNKSSFELDQLQQQLDYQHLKQSQHPSSSNSTNLIPQALGIHDLINSNKNSQQIHQQQQQQQPIFFQQPSHNGLQSSQQHQQQQQYGHKRVNSIGSGIQNKKNSGDINNLITPASVAQLNSQINFGFGQASNKLNQMAQDQIDSQSYLKDKHQQLKQKVSQQNQDVQSSQRHFHQRKNSLFLQQQLMNTDEDNNIQLRNKFYHQNQNPQYSYKNETNQRYNKQNLDEDENECSEQVNDDASKEVEVMFEGGNAKSRFTHRRATTNLIQPNSSQLLVAAAKNMQVPSMPQSTSNHQIVAQNGKVIFNDDIGLVEERDKLIKYIKLYTSKRLEIPTTTLDYYKFMKLIGKGAFGKVTLGIHKLTGKQVAIKTVDKSLMKDEYQKKKVLQEVHLLKKVRHQNVIRLLEVFESPKHLLMVMEYAGGGDLLQYVKKRRRLEEEEARRIFKQVVYGLAHCHCRSVLHRDIKLDNILLDNEGEIKICDFGVSRIIKKNQRITEQCGTPAYIAPEIISDAGYEGFNADIWSLGVLLYAMLCGTVPFKAQNMHDLHQIITSGEFAYPSQVEPLLSLETKDLINKMLVINPKDRISIPEILSHPWMQGHKDELMLQQEQDDMIDFANGTFHMNNKHFNMMGSSNFPSESINETQNPNAEPDINQVQIDNLFIGTNSYKAKLSYTDYCAITQDFATMHMNEEALQVMEGMGLPRKLVRDGLNKGELNHATATYNLLVLN